MCYKLKHVEWKEEVAANDFGSRKKINNRTRTPSEKVLLYNISYIRAL